MHIVVCIKLVPNPEAAFSMFRIDERAKKVIPAPGLQWVVSPFDEQAVEAALRIREKQPGTRISVMTLGPEAARNALKHGLAMGADDGVLLADAAFEDGDGYTTALTLAAAIRKLGSIDLVLAGRQAADWDAGVVGAGVAELLQVPLVSFARDVQVEGGAHLPRRGRALITPNHSGVSGFDAMVLQHEITRACGRPPRVLTHHLWFLTKTTAIPAN
ncbi:MAG: hypothetical protein K2Y16_14865, partial [Burkholderiales bacterium]|nr:hypothetical protein [Burkholderiales bacterium]